MLERRSQLTAVLLSFFFGVLGVDRFYLGCTWTGVLKLITFGGLTIWALIDFIRLAVGDKLCGNFLWTSEITKNSRVMSGGACTDDVLCITLSLVIGVIIFYIFVFPWLKKKFYTKSVKETSKEAVKEASKETVKP